MFSTAISPIEFYLTVHHRYSLLTRDCNVVADALSRIKIASVARSTAVIFHQMAKEQASDPDIQQIIKDKTTTSLQLKTMPVG